MLEKLEFLTVQQGEDRVLNLTIEDSDGNLQDISSGSGTTEIEVRLPLAVGGYLSKKLSLSQVALTNLGVSGRYSVSISATETLTLMARARQDFYAYWTKNSSKRIVRYAGQLTVLTPSL